jgi:6-phosphogluconolactonase
VEHKLVTVPDAASLAAQAATFVAARARAALADHGRFSFAVSGGKTPWAMFAELKQRDMPWASVEIFQVDERIAPAGAPERNLTQLRQSLGEVQATVRPMPVTESNLEAAADRYAGQLPGRFDLVHLGLGPDGHTASLVPGDPVLEVTSRLVAVTGTYQGRRRMTLTYPALARAEEIMWLVSGKDKQQALAKLLAGVRSIPAGRVEAGRSTILADAPAAKTAR